MSPKDIIALLLIVLGILAVINPKIMVSWAVWKSRVLAKAQFIPSPETANSLRRSSVVILLLGLLIWLA